MEKYTVLLFAVNLCQIVNAELFRASFADVGVFTEDLYVGKIDPPSGTTEDWSYIFTDNSNFEVGEYYISATVLCKHASLL